MTKHQAEAFIMVLLILCSALATLYVMGAVHGPPDWCSDLRPRLCN